jgi:hypothetical protein
MATDNELTRLADMTHALRPDWPSRSVRVLLAKHHRDKAYADLAVALAIVAADPKSRTPARVSESGRWWTAAQVATMDLTPGPPHPDCIRHAGEPAGRCGRCAAEAAPDERRRVLLADLRALARSGRIDRRPL